MNNIEEIKIKDLIHGIQFLGNRISGGDTIYDYSKSPIHIMVHNEILKFSKEDLENCKEKTFSGSNLWNISFAIKNPYIMSAFLKKGAFLNKLSNNSTWLINALDEPTKDIFQSIYYIEETKFRYNSYPEQKQLYYWILDQFNDLSKPEHIAVLDKYLKDFGQKDSAKILKHIVQNPSEQNNDFYSYIVSKLKIQGLDISKNSLLNDYLPDDKNLRYDDSSFFISSTYFPHIKYMLQLGFRFDEKKYSFKEDNLFLTVVKTKNKNLIDMIVPYLSNVKPKKGSLNDQNKVIEMFNNSASNSYNWVKKHYDYLLMSSELPAQNKNNDNKKLKI